MVTFFTILCHFTDRKSSKMYNLCYVHHTEHNPLYTVYIALWSILDAKNIDLTVTALIHNENKDWMQL